MIYVIPPTFAVVVFGLIMLGYKLAEYVLA
jgi:hypothetical protein